MTKPKEAVNPPGMTTVPDVKPATVTTAHAWRIVIGRFITRWVETFAGTVVGVTLFMPQDSADWQKLFAVLAPPTVTATYQAARAAWPGISAWLNSGGAVDPVP